MNKKPQPPLRRMKFRNPRNSAREERDLFEEIYGEESDFQLKKKEQTYVPEYSGYTLHKTPSVDNIVVPPAPLDMSKNLDVLNTSLFKSSRIYKNYPSLTKQSQVPSITVPKRRERQTVNSARTRILLPPVSREIPPSLKTPRAMNDSLTYFDEENFEEPEFKETIQQKVSQKPLNAESLFMKNDGTFIWKPCTVISIDNEQYTIQWKDSGKKKTVHRLAVKLDDEDENRFKKRRKQATENREEIVSDIKLTAYLQMRSTENPVLPDPELIKKIIKMLDPEDRKAKQIPSIIQEFSNIYSYAHTLSEFRNECKVPENVKAFQAEGIPIIAPYAEKSIFVPRLPKARIHKINLPLYTALCETNKLITELISDNFCKFVILNFSSGSPIKEYFNEIEKYMKDRLKYISKSLIMDLTIHLDNMVSVNEAMFKEPYTNMMNLRLNYGLGTFVINILRNLCPEIIRSKKFFALKCGFDLKSFTPQKNELIEMVTDNVNYVYSIFETHQQDKLDTAYICTEKLRVFLPELENEKQNAIITWTSAIENSFKEINAYIEEIEETTKDIPLDPMKTCAEILPEDFDSVLKWHPPTVDSKDINLDIIREKLTASRKAYSNFCIKFKRVMKFGIFNVDFNDAFVSIKKRNNEFYNLIFTYLTAQTDKQIENIGGMTTTLINQTHCAPETIEAWYVKHNILIHIKLHITEIQDTFDYLFVILNFMADFLYEPANGLKVTFKIKSNLNNIYLSIKELNLKDQTEKNAFIEEHMKEKEVMQKRLATFKSTVVEFVKKNVNENTIEENKKLKSEKEELDNLQKECQLLKDRDNKLEIDVTEYPLLAEIEDYFSYLLPAWDIGERILTEAEDWLGTVFRQLDMEYVTKTLVTWKETIENLIKKLSKDKTDKAQLRQPYEVLLKKVEFLILRLPIIKYLCNPYYRARHWKQISDMFGFEIGPNDGVTWNWLNEMNLEHNIVPLASISKSATNEAKIEKTLLEIIEELQNVSLHVTKTEKGIKLDNTPEALLLLNQHQQKIQKIFIPPYIQPFISKVKEYEVLAENFRDIIKQSIETEEKINELTPAMDSTDVRSNNSSMANFFDQKVDDFTNFANNFKISVNFARILSNQESAIESAELKKDLFKVREQLQEVLEKKRNAFPRFRLLSDSQLIQVIANSSHPSQIPEIFGLMYPAMKEARFENDEYCTGFISHEGEEFRFIDKIKVTPMSVEGWYKEFDRQIANTLKTYGKKLSLSPVSNIEKMAQFYPSQLLTLYFEIEFTNNVNKCFQSFEGKFVDSAAQKLNGMLTIVYQAIKNNLEILLAAYRKTNSVQITNMIIVLLNQRDILQKIINENISSREDPIWLAYPKFAISNMQEFNVDVSAGPCVHEYGFEYIGSNRPIIFTPQMCSFFVQMMMSLCGGANPLVTGFVEEGKSEYLIDFLNSIGKQPFVYPCHYHTTLERMKEFISRATECNAFAIFKNVNTLQLGILSDFVIDMAKAKEENHVPVFATTTIGTVQTTKILETLRIAFRPIGVPKLDILQRYQVILASVGINSLEFAKKLALLTNTIAKSYFEPFSTALSFPRITHIIQGEPFTTDNKEYEIHKRLVNAIVEKFGENQSRQLIKDINSVFGQNMLAKYNFKPTNMNEDPSINICLNELKELLRTHYGVIVSGPHLSGKTSIINMICEATNRVPAFVNPFSYDLHDLFGESTSGTLFTILQNNDTVIFDGVCDSLWLDTISVGLKGVRRMYFGNGSVLNLKEESRFIIESADISKASPATLALCGSLFIDLNLFPVQSRITHFLKMLENDTNLVEPLSHTLVSTDIPFSKFTEVIEKTTIYFIKELNEDICGLTSFFQTIQALIYNYFLIDISMDNKAKHDAKDLLKYTPHMILFALFWSYAGRVVDNPREEIDKALTKAAKKFGIDLGGRNISEVYFDGNSNQWLPWDEINKSGILGDTFELIDHEPKYLLFDRNVFMPTIYLAHEMLLQHKNIILPCHPSLDQSVIVNIIQHLPNIMEHFTSQAYVFNPNENQKNLRKMISSVLPDTVGTGNNHTIALRIPLLSILGFHSGQRSSSSELIRYIVEHDSIPAEHAADIKSTSGLKFILCGDEKIVESRLTGHILTIAMPAMSARGEKKAVVGALKALCGIENPEIGDALFKLLSKVRHSFKFSMNQLFSVLQRVGIIMLNNNHESQLATIIAHQCLRIFYDSTHDEGVLNEIGNAMDTIKKSLNVNCVDVKETAGRAVLTNFNASEYREVSCYGDIARKTARRQGGRKRRSSIRFTTSPLLDDSEEKLVLLRGVNNALRLDILAVAQIITIPKAHFELYTEQPDLSREIITRSCAITDSVLVEKQLYVPLIKVFKDTYITAGKTKKHHVLFIDANTMTKEDSLLLSVLLKTYNIYGLFEKGELLDILTKLYTDQGVQADPFKEETLETLKNYNALSADFITECEMNFHFAVVRLRPFTQADECYNTTVYSPFFSSDEYIESCVESLMSQIDSFPYMETSVKLPDVFDIFHNLREFKMLHKYPYLLSSQNLIYMIEAFVKRQNNTYSTVKGKLDKYSSILSLNNHLKGHIESKIVEMENMEKELVKLTEELERSSADDEKMEKEIEEKIEKFKVESANLREGEIKADKMQKEIADELRRTNGILETATLELKNIKVTDVAIIKNMHKPPRGVVLVIMALCVILGHNMNIDVQTDEDYAKIWAYGKTVMNDVSFLKKVTNAAKQRMTPEIVQQIKTITADPNFQPSIIERSSSAAKSICLFVRAVNPYSEAMQQYRERVREMNQVNDELTELRKKSEEALEELNKCKQQRLETQTRNEQNKQKRVEVERSIVQQRNTIKRYREVISTLKNYFEEIQNKYDQTKEEAKICERHSLYTSVFTSLAGPFSSSERDELFKTINVQSGFTRTDLLPTEDPYVSKWQRTNMPYTEQWKENTAMLSPENGRWVIAENLHMLSTSYLKTIIDRQSVNFISALSPTFDDDFVASISSQVGLVVYDFDFSNPNLVVPVVCRARELCQPFTYNGESINVPKDFFVVIGCYKLPEQYSIGMNVELVKFTIDDDVNAEQIAHKAYQLTNSANYQNSVKADIKLVESLQAINEKEDQIISTLCNAQEKIFSDTTLQNTFNNLRRDIAELSENVTKYKEEFTSSYNNFDNVLQLSKGIVQEYKEFPVTSSLWKMFEGSLSKISGLRIEDFADTIRYHLLPTLAAIIPEGAKSSKVNDQFQSIFEISKHSSKTKPVIIVSRDTSFPISALIDQYSDKKHYILTPSKAKESISGAIQTGTVAITVCTTQESIIDILNPVYKVLGANFISNDFRLFICVLGQDIKLSSAMFTKADVIYLNHPSTIDAVFKATSHNLTKAMIESEIPMLDAKISIGNRLRYGTHIYSYENAKLALQTMHVMSATNKKHIIDFLMDYFYPHGRLSETTKKVFVAPRKGAIDLTSINFGTYIEKEKMMYSRSSKTTPDQVVGYLELDGRKGQKISNFTIIGVDKAENPTFSVKKREEGMKEYPLITDGIVVASIFMDSDAPIEIVTSTN